ncbi:hypothetical protein [Massilia sp. YIM B04103]|uniref:hypothetical protein n=1 Tax=Massilia sp. YIM B04103 TaxID=2963106 RepID=UPI002109A7C9|nr:hypothetical protein [Massilia sp. YIM B04103]
MVSIEAVAGAYAAGSQRKTAAHGHRENEETEFFQHKAHLLEEYGRQKFPAPDCPVSGGVFLRQWDVLLSEILQSRRKIFLQRFAPNSELITAAYHAMTPFKHHSFSLQPYFIFSNNFAKATINQQNCHVKKFMQVARIDNGNKTLLF